MRRPIVAAVTLALLFAAAAIAAEKEIGRRRPARWRWTYHNFGHDQRLYGDV